MTKLDILAQHLGQYKTLAGNNHYFECPSCHHHNHKLTLNIEKSVFNCWHCEVKGKSFLYLLKLAGVSNLNQYKKIFNEEAKINIEDISNVINSQK